MKMTGTGENDSRFMQRCLDLAAQGRGAVSPNPLVGAVIVKDGRTIGEGYHQRFGGPHAEVNAVRDAERRGASVEGATLYVSLEPCFHHGKTPPCVDLIIAKRLARVVAAVTDPNPLVNGKSIRRLRRAGIDCLTGVLRRDAERLNAAFFTHMKHARPFVALKTAQTADGFIARSDSASKWITNSRSRRHVHMLRASFDAVLVGAGTVVADDPMLTVRGVKGRDPLRVILDGRLAIPLDAAIVRTSAQVPTVIYTARTRTAEKRKKISLLESLGAAVVELKADRSKRFSIADVLSDLGAHHITSVLVEGGAEIYREFLRALAADALFQFTSTRTFGSGIPGVDRLGVPFARKHRLRMLFGKDVMDEYDLAYPRAHALLHGSAGKRTRRKQADGTRDN